jgi:hypothetical protein
MSAIEQPLLGLTEDVGRLGHKMHPAKDYELRVRLRGHHRKLVGISREVRMLHNVVTLIVVA